MDSTHLQLVILADAPDALVELFGISMLERLLRMAQRLDLLEPMIVSRTPELITAHLVTPSWARSRALWVVRPREPGPLRIGDMAPGGHPVLLVSAGLYYDRRLLQTLAA